MKDVVVRMIFGSTMYGMNTPESDVDYKTVLLASSRQVLLQQADFSQSTSTGTDNSRNGADDIDEEYFSIMQFLKLASKGETLALDMLHAPQSAIIEESLLWKKLVKNRSMFYTKNMKAYIGYVRKQAAKYGVKGSRLAVLEDAINVAKETLDGTNRKSLAEMIHALPINEHAAIITINNEKTGDQTFYEICGRKFQDTNIIEYFIEQLTKIYDSYGARAQAAKDNNGIDWKALHHALRAGYQAKYIYTKGGFSYPLPERDFLMDVKAGKLDYMTEVQPVLEALVDEVMILAEESNYPEKVDWKEIEDLILSIHSDIINEERLLKK